ncbi:MAG: hypothetical protein K2Q18_13770, partial [Bdellovibrionales bacterium]|nr:hypothetical protein [Bdellovibrionales bacterium]
MQEKSRSGRLPDGFIFHGGRTGSTLLVRMLKSLDGVEVFSEIDLVTQIINDKDKFSSSNLKTFIQNALDAYLKCVDKKSKCFFKFTSTDTVALSLFMKYYPQIPIIYLFDSPDRILSSQLLRPPRWIFDCVRLAQKNGYKRKETESLNLVAERIKAQSYILNKSFKIVLNNVHKSEMLILPYEDLFTKKVFRVFKHLGLNVSKADVKKIEMVKLIDAKNPTKKFSKVKRESSTPKILATHFFQPKSLNSNYQKLISLSKS